jgi:hypothetical protein
VRNYFLGCLGIAAFFGSTAQVPGQTPQGIVLLKYRSFRQSSATNLVSNGGGFVVEVHFAPSDPPNLNVALRSPGGGMTALNRDIEGSYLAERIFSDLPTLDAALPTGNYTVLVNGVTTTTFTFSPPPEPEPIRVTNYEELQAWPTENLVEIRWPAIVGAGPDDFLNLTIERGNDTEVFSTPETFDPNSTSVLLPMLSFLDEYTGNLIYAHFSFGTASNGVQLVQASAFQIKFKIGVVAAPPLIVSQPVSQTLPAGRNVRFDLGVQSQLPLSYQWNKNGVPIAGATNREINLSNIQVSDAAAYSANARNSRGSVTSATAWLIIQPHAETTLYAGQIGSSGVADGAIATARLSAPTGMAMDTTGVIYFCDTTSHLVRKLTPNGIVSTIAGSPGLAGGTDGTGSAARFNGPRGIALDSQGNMYVVENLNHTIRKITPAGVVTTVAGTAGQSGARDGVGRDARFLSPMGIAVTRSGILYVADSRNNLIRMVTPAGTVTTLAGSTRGFADGTGTYAQFDNPEGIAAAGDDMLYVADAGNVAVRTVSPAGQVSTFHVAHRSDSFHWGAIAVDASGFVYVVDPLGGIVARISPAGFVNFLGGAGTYDAIPGGAFARFVPYGIVRDASGTIYISDGLSHTILKFAIVPGSTDPHLIVTTPPSSHAIATGDAVLLTTKASGPAAFNQWRRDGAPIPGATDSSLLLRNVKETMSGNYSLTVSNPAGAVTSTAARLIVGPTQDLGRLTNLSIRSRAGSGARTLIVGLAVAGNVAAAGKPIVIRGIGPGLNTFGVQDSLVDPALAVFRGTQVLATNDDWGGAPALHEAFAAVGAFPLAPSSHDAALGMNLAAAGYSVQLAGQGSASGVALAEVYDADSGPAPVGSARLVNLSARTEAGTGADVLIAGFVVRGITHKTVLIRGIGPALERFGLGGVLRDPELKLFRGATLIASNDTWFEGEPAMANVFRAVGAFPINSLDSAILITLEPGSYTVQLADRNRGTGIALVEIYEVQ